jgi:hypothetical protein
LADDIITLLLRRLASGAVWMTKEVIGQAMATTTSVDLSKGGWFWSVARQLMPVDELVVAPLLFAATLGAIVRQDMRRLARAWCAGLPLALLGGFAAVELAQVGLQVTDALSSAIEHQISPDLQNIYVTVIAAGIGLIATAGPVIGLFILVFLGGALAIWLELVLRSSAIELAVLFMPLAFAGMIWPATAHWARRLVEVLAALLLAKPVIVAALCLGSHALAVGDSASSFVTGIAIVLMAAFAPMALLKLVPVVEVSAIAHMEGLSRQPLHAAEHAVQKVMAKVGAVRGGSSSGETGETASAGDAGHLLSNFGRNAEPGDDHPLGPAQPPRGAPEGGLGDV